MQKGGTLRLDGRGIARKATVKVTAIGSHKEGKGLKEAAHSTNTRCLEQLCS